MKLDENHSFNCELSAFLMSFRLPQKYARLLFFHANYLRCFLGSHSERGNFPRKISSPINLQNLQPHQLCFCNYTSIHGLFKALVPKMTHLKVKRTFFVSKRSLGKSGSNLSDDNKWILNLAPSLSDHQFLQSIHGNPNDARTTPATYSLDEYSQWMTNTEKCQTGNDCYIR